MKRIRFTTLVALAISTIFSSGRVLADVLVHEEQVVIPTYLIGPPDPNPKFYVQGQASQGAEHRVYPYPLYDNLTTTKADKTYRMVYLENEYLKIGILPEIGGKIFEAIDKTNGYNFFYRQHVIKPALISLLGAWISGGVEWDVPHHHRATSFLPVQYNIDSSASDGSKTVWVGELELRDRMRWAVGITLHPGKAYVEAQFRMINRTPVPTSMLCFSNVAVSVNDDYQVIFPPSTQYVTYHAKVEFATWPIGTGTYRGYDFTGIDESWYKNHINSNSMFAWNYTDDFFAGYDHGKHAGTMSIADHNVVPGKKFWTWGNGPRGRMEDKLLTDDDGPYIELMVGAYSDNQPDYTWLAPYESRQWTQYWYPFRDIDGVKNANTEAAVNFDVKDGKARVGFYTTSEHKSAVVSLKLKDQSLLSETVAIDPGKPFVKDGITLPAGADEHDLRAAISVDGKELVSYSPIKLQPQEKPGIYVAPGSPQDIKTNEELYLAGLRIDAFHNPQLEPEPYWEEALKRDPSDIRNNTALAINYIKRARYADAEKLLRTAIARATYNYTTPKDAEPFYYLGLALRAQGKLDEAFDNFYKATWSAAWRSPAYFEAAQIASARGDAELAIAYAGRALQADATNIRALTFKAALLCRSGREDEARPLAAAAQRLDPLDIDVAQTQYMLDKSEPNLQQLRATMTEFPATVLELAAECMNAGQWQAGTKFLTQYIEAAPDKSKVPPLVYYDIAYCSQKLNEAHIAGEYFDHAAKAPPDYVFPFQREQIDVLEAAMAANPSDAHAPYYLGNLLFDWQPQRAVELWEKSVSLGADFPVVYRNLANYYMRSAPDKALAYLEKAASLGGNALVFNDLDTLYETNGVAPEKRLAMMEDHQKMLDRDDVLSREINLKILAGKPDDAINIIKQRFFHTWEGSGNYNVGDSWTNAMLVRGQQDLASKHFKEALADFQGALVLPPNLLEATIPTARKPEVDYWIGRAYEGMADSEKAKQAWTESANATESAAAGRGGRGFGGARGGRGGNAIAAGSRVVEAVRYYQALSFQKLGDNDKAKAIFEQLAQSNFAQQNNRSAADAHYLAGLGELGLKNTGKAKDEFALSLKANPDHLGAKRAMMELAQ